MKKKLTEAKVRLDITGIETDDLELVKRILELAGQSTASINNVFEPVEQIPAQDFEQMVDDTAEEVEEEIPLKESKFSNMMDYDKMIKNAGWKNVGPGKYEHPKFGVMVEDEHGRKGIIKTKYPSELIAHLQELGFQHNTYDKRLMNHPSYGPSVIEIQRA